MRLAYIIAGVGGVLYLTIGHTHEAFLPILTCLNRAGSTMYWNICYISVVKLFPTRYLATMYGVLNLVAHLFACLAPLAAEIPDPFPFVLYVIAIVISYVCSYKLRELDQEQTPPNEKGKDNEVEIEFSPMEITNEITHESK